MATTTINLTTRILVPLDDSAQAERALPVAVALAAPGDELLLLRVIGSLAPATERDTAKRALEAIAARVSTEHPELGVNTALEVGNADTAILSVAKERGVGLVTMATRGRTESAQRALGSVADRVASAATVPVLVVPVHGPSAAAGNAPFRRLLVPLDGSDLAATAVPVAETVAGRCGAALLLFAAIDPATAAPPPRSQTTDRTLTRDVMAEHRADALRLLEQTGTRLLRAGRAVTWEVAIGPAADAILNAVADGDLIAMTSRGEGRLGRWPLGSVAERVLRYAPVPVLVLPASLAAGDGGGRG